MVKRAVVAAIVTLGFAAHALADNDLLGRIEFHSPDDRLAGTCQWARRQAMDYVFTGDPFRTTFTSERGPALMWQAEFDGEADELLVNGEATTAHTGKGYLGRKTTCVRVPVGAGDSVTVEMRGK